MTSDTVGASDDAPEFMLLALSLARRGLGNVWPNPAVGCVIVKNGRVLGRGWTLPGGRPHAETEALKRAGTDAQGATAHVTLEPCSHSGQTGPCADALIAAGVACVVGAMEDPDPRVSGAGYERLEAAGIRVIRDRMKETAEEVNAGFLSRIRRVRPLFTLKTATTLDGRIATGAGDSQWITGEEARAAGQLLRLQHDAIMVGSNTALDDDPTLTMRVPGVASEPKRPRIVVDGRLRLSPASKLVLSIGDAPLWIVTQKGHATSMREPLEAAGAVIIEVPAADVSGVDIAAVARELAERGLTRVLVEGGGQLAASLLKAELIDRIAWFRAPTILGGDGLPSIAALGLQTVSQLFEYNRQSSQVWGRDTFELLTRKR